ncbi:PAS domain-containing protein [Methylobacterium sp. BTF04]|nr:PAS domain-containing protein [Methylobacterium sp. BTF04]
MRANDWGSTKLGDPGDWPPALMTLVSVLLSSRQPMFVAWGEDRILLYNDAYAPMLAARHPAALGRPFFEVWPEISDAIGALMDRVFAGEPVHMNDLELTLHRNGYPEQTHFAFSYTPVPGKNGIVDGLFCACTETTFQVQAERRAANERRRQRHLLQQMPGFVAVLAGPDHVFEHVNDAYVTLAGPRAFVGLKARNVFPELTGQGFFELLDEVYRTGLPFAARAMPIHLAGETEKRFIDFLYQPIRDDDGTVTGIFAGGYDITERVRAEEALRSTERRQAFMLALGDSMREQVDPRATMQAAVDALGRHIGASRVGYGLIGSDGDTVTLETEYLDGVGALVGTYPIESFGPGNIANLRAGRTSVYADVEDDPGTAGLGLGELGIAALISVPLVRVGQLRSALYVNQRVPRVWTTDEVELVEEVASRIWDAVERARADAARRESEEQFRVFAQVMPNQVWAASADGHLYWFNDQVYAYCAAVPGELDGTAWTSIVHPDDLDAAGLAWARSVATGEVYEAEFRIRRFDAAYHWFLVRAEPILGPSGEILRWVGTNTDIEDQKRISAELRHLNETLEQRVEERTQDLLLAEDALRQAQKMEAVGQLTGGVAHDFNNLLTVIKSSTDLLKRPDLPEERRLRYVGAISDTVARAAKLTGQLLAFARRQALKPEVFDVGRSVLGVADMVGTLTGARIRIVTNLAEVACYIDADPSQFDTAIVNMAVNARDAMEGEGVLTISVAATSLVPAMRSHHAISGDFVAVSISDTGSGIAPENVERIFEPFFTTKDVGQGTGLGLSQVFGFAKQSGGEIGVESTPGVGTTFTLYLPQAADDGTTARGPEDVEPLSDGHGMQILVVEDNIDVGTFATQTLAELGYATVWAKNADEALAELATDASRFDVVFTDVVMPGMNGIDLAHEIRRRYHELPVLLASGYSHVLAKNGTYGFELLHKPYSVEQLSRTLRKVATSWQSRMPAV